MFNNSKDKMRALGILLVVLCIGFYSGRFSGLQTARIEISDLSFQLGLLKEQITKLRHPDLKDFALRPI